MFRLALYEANQGSEEYVVILSEDENPDDHLRDGFRLDHVLYIDGDATEFPTDRILHAN
jgi:hypothetical protein